MRQNSRNLRAHRFDHIANPKQSPSFAFLERFDDSHCHRHAEIGTDERFFQLIPIDGFASKLLREGLKEIHVAGSTKLKS